MGFVRNKDGWLVPDVDRIGYGVIQNEAARFGEIMGLIPPDRRHVAVQGGGHIGIMPKLLAANFEKVYTFEPQPQNFTCLVYNVAEENVVKLQACMGQPRQHPVKMNGFGANTAASYVEKAPGLFPVIAVDDLDLPELDLLMVDVEGYEFDVLLGAERTIGRAKPAALVLENIGHSARYDISADDVDRLARSFGYRPAHRLERDTIYLHKSRLSDRPNQ